jgi:hypothetical protein
MANRIIEGDQSEPRLPQGSRREATAGGTPSREVASLPAELASRKAELVDRWLDKAARIYPPETAPLLKREGDPFGNPVGFALSTGISGLVDGLLSDADAAQLEARVEPILRIRSVQSLSPSQALGFVFELKDVIREVLGDALLLRPAMEWIALEARIDQLALLCFEIFTRWRESVHEIRVRDIKRQLSGYLRRFELAEGGSCLAASDASNEDPRP